VATSTSPARPQSSLPCSFDGAIGGGLNINLATSASGSTINTTGTIGHGVSMTLGNGSYSTSLGGQIGGNFSVNAGNGTNTIDVTGIVGGSALLTMGNGTNSFTLDTTGQILGPTLRYTGGTRSDTVILQNGLANPFALDVIFKGGSRTLTFNTNPNPGGTPTTVASSYIDFGTGPGGSKNLTFDSPISWPFTLLNYP